MGEEMIMMIENKEVEDKMKVLEEGLQKMFSSNNFSIDFKHLGQGKYQFTKEGQPCIFDEESEFRLRLFLNSFNILTEVNQRDGTGKEE